MQGVEYVVEEKGKKKAVQRTYGGFESVITVLWGSNGRSGFHFRPLPFALHLAPCAEPMTLIQQILHSHRG